MTFWQIMNGICFISQIVYLSIKKSALNNWKVCATIANTSMSYYNISNAADWYQEDINYVVRCICFPVEYCIDTDQGFRCERCPQGQRSDGQTCNSACSSNPCFGGRKSFWELRSIRNSKQSLHGGGNTGTCVTKVYGSVDQMRDLLGLLSNTLRYTARPGRPPRSLDWSSEDSHRQLHGNGRSNRPFVEKSQRQNKAAFRQGCLTVCAYYLTFCLSLWWRYPRKSISVTGLNGI